MLARRYLSLVLLAFCTVAGPAFAATPGDATVPGYHGGPDRSGHYILPGLTWDRAARVHLDPTFDGRVQGHVYAQPLYWKPPGARSGLLIVATESNLVYALDAATGREVWHREVGAPVARSALPCGNIDPLGITGTPVLDEGRGAVYLDAIVDEHGTPQHLVFGLSLKDGSVLPGWPVNIASGLRAKGAAFNVPVQGQRSALLLLGDRLYVPFGGHFGDCGDYHGWVVGLRVDRPEAIAAWTTRARKGGIWAPGGISSDGQSLFVATGNTEGARTWGDGEAVLRLAPDLHRSTDARDFFAPTNWRQLDDEDADLGGSNPLPLDLPGDRGAASLLLALGKDGHAYLLDRRNLGGIGGSLLVQRVSTRSIITAPATYPGREGVFVVFPKRGASCPGQTGGSGLTSIEISAGPRLRTAWCAPLDGRGAPIVTTTDGSANPIVWVVGAEGDNRLHGFRGDTGEPVFSGGGAGDATAGLRHFVTILAAEDRLYVAGDGRIYAFSFGAP